MNLGFLERTSRWHSSTLVLCALCVTACGSSDDSAGMSSGSFYDPSLDPNTGSSVSLGGSQDFGFARDQIDSGAIPTPESLDDAGFFAEHYIDLPPPSCGKRVCVQPMLAVMSSLVTGETCTMLEVGLNSPIAADPTQRPPLSLAVVVDVSGSMQGEKIAFVRDGLGMLVDGMKDGDQLSIVTYSDSATVVTPLGAVENNRVALRSTVESLVAGGSTNLAAGLQLGYEQILGAYDSARQNRVILLSDGQPTQGLTQTAAILDLSRGYNSDGIGLTTIGLGADFNIDLMRGLALQADGNFYFLEDAGAVDEVFVEELSFFVVPIAFDLELGVTAGQYYDFGRAYGTPFWQNGARGGSMSVPSVFIAHRDSDADVTASGGRRGGGSKLILELTPTPIGAGNPGSAVATIDVSYREPGTNQIASDTVEVTYPYATNEVLPQGYFDSPDLAAAQKTFVMLNIFVGIQRVSTAYYGGTAGAETARQLDGLIAAVEDYNDEIGDVDIAADLDMLRRLRENLRAEGIGVTPAPPPADPWPAD